MVKRFGKLQASAFSKNGKEDHCCIAVRVVLIMLLCVGKILH